MLKIAVQDLIVRLDEERNVLQFLVPKKAGKAGELRIFYEISEDEIPGAEGLENHIGTAILAFLSATYAGRSFRLDQYRQAGMEFGQSLSDETIVLQGSGDADSEFEGVMLYLNRFDETWTLENVDGVTALLEQASMNGSPKATQFLRDDWPARSKILKKRLGRSAN